MLSHLLGPDFAARSAAFGRTARTLHLRGGLAVAQRPLAEIAGLPPAPSLVLHLAFLTQEKAAAMGEAAYVDANRAISAQVAAALDQIGAEGVFVASSGAAGLIQDPSTDASGRRRTGSDRR
jgi:hypothetical protein